MGDRLRKPFRRWQKEREAALVKAGANPVSARNLTIKEARGRQRAAKAAGNEASLAGTLFHRDMPNGTTRFFLALPADLIPADRREAVRDFFAEGQPTGAPN